MKNKKNLYFLLPAVLIIWGILIYKIVWGISPKAQNNQLGEQAHKFTPKIIEQSETFSIQTDYRDPFLGTFEKRKKKRTIKAKKIQAVEKEIVPFPSIVYKGIVSPKGKNEKVFLISINGKQYLLKKNKIADDVRLIKGNGKEITLQFQKQIQTFQLEK